MPTHACNLENDEVTTRNKAPISYSRITTM